MTSEQVRKMLRPQPFQPFDIHLEDGRSLSVEHPEFVALAPGGRTAGIGVADGTIEIVDLLLVTSLESRPNGARRRRSRKKRPE